MSVPAIGSRATGSPFDTIEYEREQSKRGFMVPALSIRRWAIILAPVVGAALTIIGVIADPAPAAEGRELIAAYAANPGPLNVKSVSYHFAYTLWFVAALGLAVLVRRRGAWLANVAGLLALLGISTIPGFLMVDFIDSTIGQIAGVDVALRVSEAAMAFWGFFVMQIPGLVGLFLALPLAAIAAWRAGLIRWWGVAAVIAGEAVFFGFNVTLIGNVLHTIAFAIVTVSLAKIDPAAWDTPDAWPE